MRNAISSSGRKTSSAVISALPGRLHGIVVETDGTNAATVIVYDNASTAAGAELGRLIVAGATRNGVLMLPTQGVEAANGVYVAISGTGAGAIVYYSQG
jgi:hypothetical protein